MRSSDFGHIVSPRGMSGRAPQTARTARSIFPSPSRAPRGGLSALGAGPGAPPSRFGPRFNRSLAAPHLPLPRAPRAGGVRMMKRGGLARGYDEGGRIDPDQLKALWMSPLATPEWFNLKPHPLHRRQAPIPDYVGSAERRYGVDMPSALVRNIVPPVGDQGIQRERPGIRMDDGEPVRFAEGGTAAGAVTGRGYDFEDPEAMANIRARNTRSLPLALGSAAWHIAPWLNPASAVALTAGDVSDMVGGPTLPNSQDWSTLPRRVGVPIDDPIWGDSGDAANLAAMTVNAPALVKQAVHHGKRLHAKFARPKPRLAE